MATEKVMINNQLCILHKILGEGFEAVVLLEDQNQLAVKLWKTNVPNFDIMMNVRKKKMEALVKMQMPDWLFGPVALAYDETGRTLRGMAMRLMPNTGIELEELISRNLQRAKKLTVSKLLQFGINLHSQINHCHTKMNFILGDFNSKNAQIIPGLTGIICDVDAGQVGNIPCVTGTFDFLSPRILELQNSLQQGNILFQPADDVWSLLIHIIRSTLRVHPFHQGNHAVDSVVERVLDGIGILGTDGSCVDVPKKARPLATFSDRLLNHFYRLLIENKSAEDFDINLLHEELKGITTCSDCGEEYHDSRNQCPHCKEVKVMPAKPIPTMVFKAMRILLEGIPIHHVRAHKGKIFVVAGDQLEMHQFDGLDQKRNSLDNIDSSNVDVKVGSAGVVIVSNEEIPSVKIFKLNGSMSADSVTSRYMRHSQFGVGNNVWLLGKRKINKSHDFHGTTIFKPTLPATDGNTWYQVETDNGGNDVLVGFHHLLDSHQWFVYSNNKKYEAKMTALDSGKEFMDAARIYVAKNILVIRRIQTMTGQVFRLDVISQQGELLLNTELLDGNVIDRVTGRAFNDTKGYVVLHPSDKGIIWHNLETGETKILSGSEDYVTDDDDLIKVTTTQIAVVKYDSVILLDASSK